jgi:hypothetical protein
MDQHRLHSAQHLNSFLLNLFLLNSLSIAPRDHESADQRLIDGNGGGASGTTSFNLKPRKSG